MKNHMLMNNLDSILRSKIIHSTSLESQSYLICFFTFSFLDMELMVSRFCYLAISFSWTFQV